VRRADRWRAAPGSTAVLIGGAEDKSRERTILREIAQRARGASLAICTAGSVIPDELFDVYRAAFRGLGASNPVHIDIRKREDADGSKRLAGGGASTGLFVYRRRSAAHYEYHRREPVHDALGDLYRRGETIAGTSAGASAVGHTMPMSAEADDHKVSAAWQLVPGLGMLEGVIVDQHFAQRGRMGRLVAGVVENPRLLGLGIDENTALAWRRDGARVVGSGAVYVVDGRQITRSNLGKARLQSAISAFDIRVHVLSEGDCFDIAGRRPMI
jgi:cyanophycinase